MSSPEIRKLPQDPKGSQELGAQALPDFGATLLAQFDHWVATEDKDAVMARVNSLHGDDFECLAMALGRRHLDKLGLGQ